LETDLIFIYSDRIAAIKLRGGIIMWLELDVRAISHFAVNVSALSSAV
jgi:hypothetical protein